MRIRHYGLLANRNKCALLEHTRAELGSELFPIGNIRPEPPATPAPESIAAFWQRVAGIDIARCTHCGLGTLRLLATLAPQPRPPP